MANVDLSIIIPARNNKAKNASIIKMIADETRDLDVEFIVIDMNSTDGGVLEALNMMKTGNLKGSVIQFVIKFGGAHLRLPTLGHIVIMQ